MKTNNSFFYFILSLIIVAALLGAASFISYKRGFSKGSSRVVVRRDTSVVVVHDTIETVRPVAVISRVVDSILVPVVIRETDTVAVALPREEKVYQDSTYRAVVSGFMPSLDSISVFRSTSYVTIETVVEAPVRRVSWGMAAGPSVLVDLKGHVDIGFGVTGGVVIRF